MPVWGVFRESSQDGSLTETFLKSNRSYYVKSIDPDFSRFHLMGGAFQSSYSLGNAMD